MFLMFEKNSPHKAKVRKKKNLTRSVNHLKRKGHTIKTA